jgi:hypothetical protein
MTGRRAIVGLCMLCALVFSAFAAQGASAAGTTAVTCKNTGPGTGTFTKAHCKAVDAGVGEYSHVTFNPNTPTDITGTNAKTNSTTTGPVVSELHSTVNGVKITLSATTVHGEGTMENKEEGGEMVAHGTGVITYTGVTVTPPFEETCEVVGGKVVTNELTAKTVPKASETLPTGLKFSPKTGEVFAEFSIVAKTGKECAISKSPYKVAGSVIGTIDGATTNFTAAGTTAQTTLRLESSIGPKAGLEGSLTISGKDTTAGDTEFTPLSVT